MQRIIVAACSIAVILLAASPVMSCEEDYETEMQVKYLGVVCQVMGSSEVFTALAKKPEKALCSLVKQLNTTAVREVWPGEWEKEIQAKNQVWRMRALSFLTCGLEFSAFTRYKKFPIRDPEGYWHWIGGSAAAAKSPGDKAEVWFFGTWMSRDIDYLAPEDAQKDIIRQWHEWLVHNGTNAGCTPDPEDYNQWYF